MQSFTQTEKTILMSNKHFSIMFEKETGNVVEFVNLYTKENILAKTGCEFLYVKNKDQSITLPKNVRVENDNLVFDFEKIPSVEVKVETFDDFVTFEVMTQLPREVYSLIFGNVEIEYDPDLYSLYTIGMTAWVIPNCSAPCADLKRRFCQVFTHFEPGTKGSKYGMCFSKKSDGLECARKIGEHIDTKVGLYSKAGALYAKEWHQNNLDYALHSLINDETRDETIERCKAFGVEQLDIHMSDRNNGGSFLQGNFEWINYNSHKEFYEKYGKKLHENGIVYALHSYAHYISMDAKEYVTDPYWQKQLLTVGEVYTLKSDVPEDSGDFPTVEDAKGFIPRIPRKPYSTILLIDEELIAVDKYTEDGFFNCKRALYGTKATSHKAGAKIYQLAKRWNLFVPQYGSELFYEIADRMAKAYNEAGYDMLYFDALDGIYNDSVFFEMPEGANAYYSQMFLQRVVSQCKRTPVLETASGSPQEYNVRGRMGAHDISVRAIKMTIKSHTEQNMRAIRDYNMIGTLGWFSFFPDADPTLGMKNTVKKTIFHDDLDMLGLYAIMYNQTMVHNPMPSFKNPFHVASVQYFKKYGDLRKSNYFTQATRDKLIKMGGEFKLIESDGEYAFKQMSYDKENLGNISSEDSLSFNGSNPFGKQKPFIRLEQRFSTKFENEIKLFDFDETKKLSEQTLMNNGFKIDITNNMVLKFKVKGTGKDKDALLVSLRTVPEHGSKGRSDFFVDLNFEGWREFVMLDPDNAEYDIEKYNFGPNVPNKAGAWSTIHLTPAFDQIGEVNLFLSGDTAGEAQISSIYAYTQVQDSVTNPTVSVGDTAITFNTTIKGGEYIEYEPDTNKALLYHNEEQTVEEVDFTGEVSIGEGAYTGKYSAASNNAHLRAKVVFGFAGQTVENIK